MAEVIAATGRAEETGLEAAMLAREEQFATGMQGGIAIPHCRTKAVNTPALGFLRLAEPVDVVPRMVPRISSSGFLARMSRALPT